MHDTGGQNLIQQIPVDRSNPFRVAAGGIPGSNPVEVREEALCLLEFRNVTKTYTFGEAGTTRRIIQNFSLQINKGDFVVVEGANASGKSTLLRLAAGSEEPDCGEILVEGLAINKMDEKRRAQLRQDLMCPFFNSNNLLSHLTARENVALAIKNRTGTPATDKKTSYRLKEAAAILEKLGLGGRFKYRPQQLSVSEKRRAALAVALVQQPPVLLLDEPTEQLDQIDEEALLKQLVELNRSSRITIILATRNPQVAAQVTPTHHLHLGKGGFFTKELSNQRKSQEPLAPGVIAPKQAEVRHYPAQSVFPPALPVLKAVGIAKTFANGYKPLREVNLTCKAGESVAIYGQNASGKSTLFNLLGGLDFPTRGYIRLNNRHLPLKDRELISVLRQRETGYIFQVPDLIDSFTVLENIMLPMILDNVAPEIRQKRAAELVELLNLEDLAECIPDQLSAGELKRVEIARSLIYQPKLLLADEPAAGLDPVVSLETVKLLVQFAKERNSALVLFTSNPLYATLCDNFNELENGRLIASSQETPV